MVTPGDETVESNYGLPERRRDYLVLESTMSELKDVKASNAELTKELQNLTREAAKLPSKEELQKSKEELQDLAKKIGIMLAALFVALIIYASFQVASIKDALFEGQENIHKEIVDGQGVTFCVLLTDPPTRTDATISNCRALIAPEDRSRRGE